jgi:hypothetical protein
MQVPSSLVCGFEGVLGVIIQIELQLIRKPLQQLQLLSNHSWDEIFFLLPTLKTFQTLKGILWKDNAFRFYLEGDDWRLSPVIKWMENQGVQQQLNIPPFFPKGKKDNQIILSSACSVAYLKEGIEKIEEVANTLNLNSRIWANVWHGAIHCQLYASCEEYVFSKRIEAFMLCWIDWLESVQGFILNGHGIGKLFRHYLPPFWKEEERRFFKQLQQLFDPDQLLRRNHFFPIEGKSVEKIYAI